jgi:hypothetical protein
MELALETLEDSADILRQLGEVLGCSGHPSLSRWPITSWDNPAMFLMLKWSRISGRIPMG